jgi:hypothetical protein
MPGAGDPWTILSRVTGELTAGSCPEAKLTRASLSGYVQQLLEREQFRVVALSLLERVDRCSPDDVAAIAAFKNAANALLGGDGPAAASRQSQVLYWNVVSSDLWESPAPSLDTMQSRCDALSICAGGDVFNAKVQAIWPTFEPDPLDAPASVTTGSSVLILNGALDPQTPLAHATTFVANLASPHKTFVTLPYSAHDTVNQATAIDIDAPPCGDQIVKSFLTNPDAPDTSCAARTLPVSFEPDVTTSRAWFGVEDFWGDSLPTNGEDAGDEAADAATRADSSDAGMAVDSSDAANARD